jgi:hypothetical protein
LSAVCGKRVSAIAIGPKTITIANRMCANSYISAIKINAATMKKSQAIAPIREPTSKIPASPHTCPTRSWAVAKYLSKMAPTLAVPLISDEAVPPTAVARVFGRLVNMRLLTFELKLPIFVASPTTSIILTMANQNPFIAAPSPVATLTPRMPSASRQAAATGPTIMETMPLDALFIPRTSALSMRVIHEPIGLIIAL